MPLLLVSRADAQRQQGAPAYTETAISVEAQAALDRLSPQYAAEIPLEAAWFRDRQLMFYGLGTTPGPLVVGRVLWPIHGFDMRGNPVAMRGQRPIFASLPGLEGYSGVWRLTYVVTADYAQPNQLRDTAGVAAMVQRKRAILKETDLTFNLPIVARGARLAGDSTEAMTGWYEGRDVSFFDFGQVSATPATMFGFVRGESAAAEPQVLRDQGAVVDTMSSAPPYQDLWAIRVVRADTSYVPNSLKSSEAVGRSNLRVDATPTIRNGPVAVVDGARVARAPSPLTAFADLRSPFPPAPTRTP
jgi:hypothetical protein